MKKALAIVALLVALTVGYCAVPADSVSAIRISVSKSDGTPLVDGVTATFYDGEEKQIVTIKSGALPSWDNNLYWWAHSSHDTSLLRPADAKRTRFAIVRAPNCGPVKVPVNLEATYVPPSPMPHGGGAAYMLYEFNRMIYLLCGDGVDTTTVTDQIGIWPGK